MATAHDLQAKTDPAAMRAAVAARAGGSRAPSMLPSVPAVKSVPPLVPCSFCDVPAFWRDGYGVWHCVECDPPPDRDAVSGGRKLGEKLIYVIEGF